MKILDKFGNIVGEIVDESEDFGIGGRLIVIVLLLISFLAAVYTLPHFAICYLKIWYTYAIATIMIGLNIVLFFKNIHIVTVTLAETFFVSVLLLIHNWKMPSSYFNFINSISNHGGWIGTGLTFMGMIILCIVGALIFCIVVSAISKLCKRTIVKIKD